MNDGLSMDDIYMDDDTTNGGGDGAQEGQDSQDPFAGSDPEADALFNGTETVGSTGTEPGVQSSDDGASGTDPGIQTGGQSSSDGGLYGSVARALMEDGILHIDDASGVTDAASLRDAIEAEIYGRMNPMQQRVTAALNYGMRPDEIQEYEGALQELGGYTDEMVADESEDGVELRKNLIYQACLARGMNDKQAEREVDKSFKAGTDLEDAKDARSTIYDALRREIGVRDKMLRSMHHRVTEVVKVDTVIVPELVMTADVDTVIDDGWVRTELSLSPGKVGVGTRVRNETTIIVHGRRETVRPPRRFFLFRLFQRKHTVVTVTAVEGNPWCETREYRSVEVVD